MSLLLDRTSVLGNNLKVTANLKIETGKLSGQTSSTASTHQGFKPKTLTVSLQIPFKKDQDLKSLMMLAQAVEKSGKRKVYRIVNHTAANFGIKQVQFSDNLSAREDENLKQWQVQFNLTEYISVPEQKEKRQATTAVGEQSTPGEAVEPEAGESQQLSTFERWLKKIDDALG